jgi:hypothetical protein
VASQLVVSQVVLSFIEEVSVKFNKFAVLCFTCETYILTENYGFEHLLNSRAHFLSQLPF